MHRFGVSFVWWIAAVSFASGVGASDRPIVAVFDLENRGTRLDAQSLDNMTAYLVVLLAQNGYQVVPRAQIQERLQAQKQKSHSACHDQMCQIELGREVAAQKSVASQIIQVGERCLVTATVYDLKRAAAERAASVKCDCSVDKVGTALETITARLAKPPTDKKPAPPAKPKTAAKPKTLVQPKTADKPITATAPTAKAPAATPRKDTGLSLVKSDLALPQPDTRLMWQRCPVGQKWSGDGCTGDAVRLTWNESQTACPRGHRPPDRSEVIELLGGCSSKVHRDLRGRCRSCDDSHACRALFGADSRRYWTGSEAGSGAWFVDFGDGDVADYSKGREYATLCVRNQRADRPGAAKPAKAPKPGSGKAPRMAYAKSPGSKLTWERCPRGQSFEDGECSGSSRKLSWPEASKACPAGFRLPSRGEMVQLLGRCLAKVRRGKRGWCRSCDESRSCSELLGPDRGTYWTSTAEGGDAWMVDFGDGDVKDYDQDRSYAVRCVSDSVSIDQARQGLPTKVSEPEAPRPRITTTDPRSKLRWDRCPVGTVWIDDACTGSAASFGWASAMKACQPGYRLPTRSEVLGLLGGCLSKVRKGKRGWCRACDKSARCSALLGPDDGKYWTSTTDGDDAWFVDFGDGDVKDYGKGRSFGVRCVQDAPR